MAEFPSVPVTAIPDPPDVTFPDRSEVGPLTLIGPTGENQQPGVLDIRTETLRGLANTMSTLFNFIQEDFLDRDGADPPITGSTQGDYFMRGDMDLGGFQIENLAAAVSIRDLITFEQLEDLQFDAEDNVEQILLDRVVFQDGSVPMLAALNMATFRVINIAAASIGTDAVRKDTVDAALAAVQVALLRTVGAPGMTANLSFDNVVPTEDNFEINNLADPISSGDLVNKKFLDDQVAITGVEDVPVASVLPYAGPASIIPPNFLLCDGREVSRFTFANLFNIIGVAYGSPSSGSVFHLPDMRGRGALPLDNLGGQTKGIIGNVNARTLGGKLGAELHALSVAEIPSHTHTYDDIHYAEGGAGAEIGDANASDADNLPNSNVRISGATGSTVGHNNLQPSMAMNWLIRF